METVKAERKALANAQKAHAQVSRDKNDRLVSAFASWSVALGVIAGLTAISVWRGAGIGKLEWFWVLMGALSSGVSSVLSGVFYKRLEKRHERREALDE